MVNFMFVFLTVTAEGYEELFMKKRSVFEEIPGLIGFNNVLLAAGDGNFIIFATAWLTSQRAILQAQTRPHISSSSLPDSIV